MRVVWRLAWTLAAGCGDESTGASPNTARLTVAVTGLPGGVAAAVQVEGPGNYGQVVPETRTFAQLAPGGYVVTAASVTAGATTYVPVPATQTVDLSSGEEETVGVEYAP